MSAKLRVGLGSCGIAAGAQDIYDLLEGELPTGVVLGKTSCIGQCYAEPLVEVTLDGESRLYGGVTETRAQEILEAVAVDRFPDFEPLEVTDTAFRDPQVKIALRNCGIIDPDNLHDYVGRGGYRALRKAYVDLLPGGIINIIKSSDLRGRGGGGFPTGLKWEFLSNSHGSEKYLVCNADEGDPGAFMDRAILEGDPHAVLEGMAIAARATGAREGWIYVRAEYPLAVARLRRAIEAATREHYLGDDILGTGHVFHVKIKEGAGAFVCGEETALMASIEGQRGMPRIRPPFPAEAGIRKKPTNINNVETYANVPWILLHGADAYRAVSGEFSGGTKVFALAGKIKRGGLVEVPMGTPIRKVVNEIGGGSGSGKPVKGVQMGGPAGGCIPARLFDTPIDYPHINETGAIMGSGGLVVMDEGTCMVEVAKYFLAFTQNESCGKCTFCRVGTRRMLEILERITAGQGTEDDLDKLEELAHRVHETSLCGLGQLAPNPVLTTLKYFRDEYLAHIRDHRCPSLACKALITYRVVADNCTGCRACAKACPVSAISGEKKEVHTIDPEICTRCGACEETCKFDAIEVIS